MTGIIHWLYLEAVSLQHDIYLSFADRIGSYAETGQWTYLAVFLPMGILFGAVHAMTPGHSKTVLAAYTAATPGGIRKAVATAFILSVVHVSVSVLIVLLSLPLISSTLGSAGRAPLLEDFSRLLIGIIGIWMIWAAFRPRNVHTPEGGNRMFAIFAGLIPCPLTFFVMTFAALHGVVEAGLAFAVVMLIGVFITLGTLAAAIAFSKQSLSGFFAGEGNFILNLGRSFQVLVGIGFVALAMATVLN